MNNIILETSKLTKSFGGVIAAEDLDFRLNRGELRCLIGPNGAGKSTFFKLLTGQLEPDRGTIVFDGDDITGLKTHERARRGISLKFQQARIYPDLSVRDNLRIPIQRTSENLDKRVDELLELTGLRKKANENAGDLSHGEQQWLEIAMAIAIDPNLLLLDEPTSGMTIEETIETGELIESLVDHGLSVIVVEHDIKFVRQIAEQITVLHNGRVFAEGTVEEIESNEDVQRIYLGKEER